MDQAAFERAQERYRAKDYASAYTSFSALAAGPLQPGETGELYHMMGNCLVRLNRQAEALEAYQNALTDTAYGKLGAVNSNMGMALIALGRDEESLKYFNAALSDPNYASPYKAFSGMGSALLTLGHPADAGIAYRRAALDEGNPNPAKALMNLGICFMALNRPDDAIEAYSTALEFESRPASRNRICANLGQAYVAAGRNMEAITAFEQATADGTYRLSSAATSDFARAQTAGLTETQVTPAMSGGPAAQQGGTTGSLPAVQMPESESIIPSAEDTGFFTITEEQIKEMEQAQVASGRRHRHTGLKVFIVILVIVVALLGAGAYAVFKGYGYPSSQEVVSQLFANAGTDQATDVWDSAVSTQDVTRAMASIEPGSTPSITSMDNSLTSSTAHVTATLPEGGSVSYDVGLVRSGLSFKVNGVTLTYASMS